jgi:hypothetical protein
MKSNLQFSADIEIENLNSDQIFSIIESARRGYFRGKNYGIKCLSSLVETARDEIGRRKMGEGF